MPGAFRTRPGTLDLGNQWNSGESRDKVVSWDECHSQPNFAKWLCWNLHVSARHAFLIQGDCAIASCIDLSALQEDR